MDDFQGQLNAINQIAEDRARGNTNSKQGEIIRANPDKSFDIKITEQDGIDIILDNRRCENDSVTYIVDTALTPIDSENPGIQVNLDIPDGNYDRAVIKGLAQFNTPSKPTVHHFSTGTSSSCFLAETLIKTISGEIKIEKIKPGMKVLGYNEKLEKICQCKVINLLIHDKEERVTEYYFLKTKYSEVRVTKNHPFYTGSGDYKQIQQITDYIYLFQDNSIIKDRIISKELIQTAPVITYNLSLTLSSPCNYFANGYLVHNIAYKS